MPPAQIGFDRMTDPEGDQLADPLGNQLAEPLGDPAPLIEGAQP
jgi:hypothetical protein